MASHVEHFDRTTERYFKLLEALRQAVITTDHSGTIIYWGPAAERLYGWSAHEVLGRDILEVTPTDLSRRRGTEIMQLLKSGEAWSGEFSVRGRTGKSFVASVTDVPLLGVDGALQGMVGVSAPARVTNDARSIMKRFAAACKKVWPRQIVVEIEVPRKVRLNASEPHLIQLLSILLLRYADALDGRGTVEFVAKTADDSPFAEFGLVNRPAAALYVRFDRHEDRATYSVLRNLPDAVQPRQYASALVRMVGGLLIAGTAPERMNAMHLFLPTVP